MKKIAIACFLFVVSYGAMAQHRPPRVNTYTDEDADEGRGFKLDHLFIGGTVNIGYNGYDFNVGGSPEIGYSFNKWFDAGALLNINYTSERADPSGYVNPDTRYRSFNYGAGAFARFYPLPFLFFQVEPEYNFVNYSATPMPNGPTSNIYTQAPSMLLGVGYGRRVIGQSGFYILLMFDAVSNPNSPYRDPYTNAALPVIKAGFDIYFHPKRK
jgi:hypothetical protein